MEEGDWSAPESSAWHPSESAGSRPPGLRLAAPHGQQSLIRVSRTASTVTPAAETPRDARRMSAAPHTATLRRRRREGEMAPRRQCTDADRASHVQVRGGRLCCMCREAGRRRRRARDSERRQLTGSRRRMRAGLEVQSRLKDGGSEGA